MVFGALLREEDFRECVWRYEVGEYGKMEIKGDVANQLFVMGCYSEMKIYDTIERVLLKKLGICRRDEIIKLSHGEIVEWYKKIFIPENLLMISHGDMHPIKLIQKFRKHSK
jgi:Zn-dependent M16 (insulinase) family peptidase